MFDFTKIFHREPKRYFCSAVILAAGASERMGAEDKMESLIFGVPVLARTMQVFESCECINEIIVVTRAEKIIHTANMCQKFGIDKVRKVIAGGSSRVESAVAGVFEADTRARLVAVHDGARPLVTCGIVQEAVFAASRHYAAAPAVPIKDSVKVTVKNSARRNLDRRKLVAIQTPQVFDADLLKAALLAMLNSDFVPTDDASVLEAMGVETFLVAGSEENIKITTPLDLVLAESILANRKERAE